MDFSCLDQIRMSFATNNYSGFASNMPDIQEIFRPCPGISEQHKHETAWGSRVVQGKRVSLAQAAGAYPKSLVQAVARVVKKHLNPN